MARAAAARRGADRRRRHQGGRARQGRRPLRHHRRLRHRRPAGALQPRRRSARAIRSWSPDRSATTASPSCSRAATSTSRRTCAPTRGPCCRSSRALVDVVRARPALDARPHPRRRRHLAQRARARRAVAHRPARGAHPDARRGARRLRAARPRSAAHRERGPVPGGGRARAWPRRRWRRCAPRPAARKPRWIGEVREQPRGTVLVEARLRRQPGRSTCWSAIRCRGSAEVDRVARTPSPIAPPTDREPAARSQRRLATLLRRARPIGSPRACHQMSERFQRGGRLLAFGRGPYATDAQHVAVEFVHPVIVGKRALPALDLSLGVRDWSPSAGAPGRHGDGVRSARRRRRRRWRRSKIAARRGAMTFALPSHRRAGVPGDVRGRGAVADPFVHQELIEILYHTLWETVHVYLEHARTSAVKAHDAGAASFLYPFLGLGQAGHQAPARRGRDLDPRQGRRRRGAARSGRGRRVRRDRAAPCSRCASASSAGGTLLLFGNGGSATDANDWALDCVLATAGGAPIPAVSLAMRARQHQRDRQRHRRRGDLPAPAHRAGAARRTSPSPSRPAAARAT